MRGRLVAILLSSALALAVVPARTAGIDVAAQAKILKTAEDFRFRVDACLKLGASGDFKARKPLEGALDDPHPTVRQAAASALAKLGDVLAVPALEDRVAKEKNPPTKQAMESAITSLKASGGVGGPSNGGGGVTTSGPPNWATTKYVVKLNKIHNETNVRASELSKVLEEAARRKFGGIDGVYVLPTDSATAGKYLNEASSKGLPVLGVDARLVSLDRSKFAGDLRIQAKVSFAFSKLAVIKSSIEGNASTIGNANAEKNQKSLEKLEDMAVDGAVMSAMAKAPTAIAAASK
ncbi:MAG: HEAT repeat domain-containing protein [Myxococcales bacterium]|nr:HEAT repeat domain-containing protein [Myxococcales bacterium]